MQNINELSRVGGRTIVLSFFLATLLAGCITVQVDCGGGEVDKNGKVKGCTYTQIAKGSPVPGGAIPINGPGPIPPGATCGGAQNTQCNSPGARCDLNPAHLCRDTYDMVSTACMCQCR